MTDKQINAAIAEACGWKTECTVCDDIDCPIDPLPDYCTDFNAMHEAERVLHEMQWFYYLAELNSIVRFRGQAEVQIKQAVHATARQRAEAFLRTLGKWEEATDKDSLTVGATTEQSSAVRKEVQG